MKEYAPGKGKRGEKLARKNGSKVFRRTKSDVVEEKWGERLSEDGAEVAGKVRKTAVSRL